MPKHPGESGLLPRLDNLQHQINELSRRSGRTPVCVVRLGANVAIPARTDVVIRTSWNTEADVDTDDMWQPGEDAHLRIPVQGRYMVQFHQQWAWFAHGAEDAMLSAKILRNEPTAPNAIGSYAGVAAQASTGGEGTATDVLTMRPALNVGDELYFLLYTQYAWTLNASANNVPTYIAAYYLGPD